MDLKTEEEKEKKGFFKKILVLTLRVLGFAWLVSFLALVLAVLFVQIPPVQHKIIHHIERTLSEEWQLDVEVGHFYLRFFDELELRDFAIKQPHAATLVSVQSLYVDLDFLPFQWLSKRFSLQKIGIFGASVEVKIEEDGVSNWDSILDYFGKNAQNKEPKKLNLLALEDGFFRDIQFQSSNAYSGQLLELSLGNGHLKNLVFRPNDNMMSVESILLDNPRVSILDDFPAEGYVLLDSIYPYGLEVALEDWEVPFALQATHLKIYNGSLAYNNLMEGYRASSPSIDFKNLQFSDIHLEASDLFFQDLDFDGRLDHLSFTEGEDFRIQSLKSDFFSIHNNGAYAYGLSIKTNHSFLGDSLFLYYNRYPDFRDLVDKVEIDFRLNNSSIGLEDILYFAAPLRQNEFFIANAKRKLKVEGRLTGYVNDLLAQGLYVNLSDQLIARGSLKIEQVTSPANTRLDFKLNELRTDLKTIKSLVPKFNYPDHFNKLGQFVFKGSFKGLYQNFKATGYLATSLGNADLNMQMDFIEGREYANYSGKLKLLDFDLGAWTDNLDFGKITIESYIHRGKGLTLEHIDAEIETIVRSFAYKEYLFESLGFTGRILGDSLSGRGEISDPNLQFGFEGSISKIATGEPFFQLEYQLDKIKLEPLRLAEKDFWISGKGAMSIGFPKEEGIDGSFVMKGISLGKGEEVQKMDSLYIYTRNVGADNQLLALESDFVQAEIMGLFKLGDLIPIFKTQFYNRFQGLSDQLGWVPSSKKFGVQRFGYRIDLRNPERIPSLLGIKNFELDSLTVLGTLISDDSDFSFQCNVGTQKLGIHQLLFKDVLLKIQDNEGLLDFTIDLGSFQLGKSEWKNIHWETRGQRDILHLALKIDNIGQKLKGISFSGDFTAGDKGYDFSLTPSFFSLGETFWKLDQSNRIVFSKDYLFVDNVVFSSEGSKKLVFNSHGDLGLITQIAGLDLSILNEFIEADRFDFKGLITADFRTSNVFNLQELDGFFNVKDFYLNGIAIGDLRCQAIAGDFRDSIRLNASLGRSSDFLKVTGFMEVPNSEQMPYFQMNLKAMAKDLPLDIAEAFIRNGISNTAGTLSGELGVKGPVQDLDISGLMHLNKGKVTIDYLGTTYSSDASPIYFYNDIIDFSNVILKDEVGNSASIKGGLLHDRFKKFKLGASISSNEFLLLNTTKLDNELYYGRGYGKAEVVFSGDFLNTNIEVDAVTGTGTKLSIPLYGTMDAKEVNFIEFTNPEALRDEEKAKRTIPEGLSFRMKLEVTNDAQIWMIFDERTGDIIKGVGTGDLILNITREGDFEMFGEYLISQGEYLFTLLNFVNKPFVIREGGSIQWVGDPFDANINLVAEYKGLRTPVYNFIQDLVDGRPELAQVVADSKVATEVQLLMNLKGALFEPDISFELGFPSLEAQLRNIVQNRLREVEADENELNRQVLGLIVFNNFFTTGFSGQDNTQFGINTLSGFLSAQISSYLSEILSQALVGVDFITGIDLDVGYNRFIGDQLEGVSPLSGEEFNVRLKNTLFNDRLAINAGANLVSTNDVEFAGGYYIAGDLAVEYYLTPARRLKIKFYNRNDQTIYGPRQRTGVGLSFRKEFDHFRELFKGGKREQGRKP
jgi:hypothetical protein